MFPANKIRIKIVILEAKPLENMQLTILEFNKHFMFPISIYT